MKYKFIFERLRTDWSVLTIYERFEQVVSLFISLLLVVIIVAALIGLIESVASLVLTKGYVVHEHGFSVAFGSMMSLLIALEFNHTIFHSIRHRGQIVRVKTVVLIAILGISREYILLDKNIAMPSEIIGLAISVLCLGIVYFILDRRECENSKSDA